MFRVILGIAVFIASFFVGRHLLEETPAGPQEDPFPKRRELQRAAWNSPIWVVLYQANSPEERAAYEDILRPLDGEKYRRTSIKVFPYEQAPDSILQRYPLFLIGQDFSAGVKTHLNDLPDLEFSSRQVQLESTTLDQAGDILQLTYLPSPHNDTLPMHLIWGNSTAGLGAYVQARLQNGIRSFLWSAWGYEVSRDGRPLLQGYFNDSTWQLDRQIHFEFNPTPGDTWTSTSAHLQAYDGAAAPPDAWLARLEADRQAIQEFTAYAGLPPLDIKLYPSVERKALRTNSMEQVHLADNGTTVHMVINDNFQGQEWGIQYRPWLRTALGKPEHSFYESGLALQWIDNIRDRPWRSWVRSLIAGGALPPLELLFDEDDRRQYAPLVGQLAAAAWVDYRLQTLGREAFLNEYREGFPRIPNADAYAEWRQWMLENYPYKVAGRTRSPSQRLNGFTLAHEGYRVYNGYGSARAFASLQMMQQIGIDAVAIVPYSFMPNANRPDPIPVAQSAGGENDEATVFAHLSAQSLGQYTLLKPQIWLGGGSWPGDIDFETEAEWQTFFTQYSRWILHYALLAEMYGFDAFCVGTEMRHTTLKQPEAWRELIRSVRRIYGGTLTYAANWGEECEQITFWTALDFVGVNCYYPLYDGDTPTDKELQQGAERVIEKVKDLSKSARRPVWLTEIGYRSATAPWQHPHAEAGKRAIDESAQARTYAAMLKACEKEKSWLRGLFWWKWPTDLDYNESRGRGYSPYGKAAEKVLRSDYLGD